MRSKEEAQDYRYFPEPDLVPVHPPAEVVERLRGEIGELPGARIRRIADALSFYDADVLVTGGLDRLWSDVVAAGADPKEAANVLANQFVATGVTPEAVDPGELAKLVSARAEIPELPGVRITRIAETLSFYDADVLVTGGLDGLWSEVVAAGAEAKEAANVLANQFVATGVAPADVNPVELAKLVEARASITRAAFDEALGKVGEPGFSAEPYMAQTVVSDTSALDPVIDQVLAANPGQVEQYRGGKQGLLGFFVGQVMKETGGSANPKVVGELLRERLSA